MGKETQKKRRRRTFLYLWVLLALAILLVAATYTWFSLSETPHVNDMAMYVNAPAGLELALEYNSPDEDWGQKIEFEDMVSTQFPLRPATWLDSEQGLVTISYGFDGRSTGELVTLTDEENANLEDAAEYYYVAKTFYARTTTPCDVSLAEAVEINEGENGAGTYVIGTPVWDPDTLSHYDGGQGAETALRVGLRVTHVDYDSGEPLGESEFFIYEPNCDTHIGDAEGYFPTAAIDGAETLVDEDHLILQKSSTWTEAHPVQRLVTIKDLGEFENNVTLFRLEDRDKVMIELYVWLEGQDSDCTNRINAAQILGSIQFHVEYNGQSGLEEIK